jgi:hypothetical protein
VAAYYVFIYAVELSGNSEFSGHFHQIC